MKLKRFLKNLQRSFSELTSKPGQSSLATRSYQFDNSQLNIVELKGVPVEYSSTQLQKYFDPFLKKISKIQVISNSIGTRSQKAIIVFKNAQEADKFIERYNNDFLQSQDHVVRLNASLFKSSRKKNKLRVLDEERQVELYNIPFEATNLDILQIMPELEIQDLQLPKKSQNKNKGFCLITFKNTEQAEYFCSNIVNYRMMGRRIYAKQKYFQFASQKKRTEKKSDFIFKKAATSEIFIKGSLSYYSEVYDIWKNN